MKVLFAASECVPFIKTGGLADVVGALPKEILKAGEDVRVILPLYKAIDQGWRDQMEHMLYFYINLGWRRQYVGIMKLVYSGITFYFVDNEQYFGRDYIYGMGGDEGERFAYFCRAVLEALTKIDFIPDVIHCHDWQTGLIPILLKAQYKHLEHYKNIRTIYTIHNLQYQGLFPIDMMEDLLYLGPWAYTSEALEFFRNHPPIKRHLQTLEDVGLGYIKLGQPSTQLSGGEAQRIKLATELSKKSTGSTLYILDEPTTGLHFADIEKLLDILSRLTDQGNTVIVIEHNLDVIKCADHIIDLGPDGGFRGGRIVAQGTPEEVARVKGSYTGQFLSKLL